MERVEAWKETWQKGFAPCFKTETLQRFLACLKEDDPRWLQEATTDPPPLQCTSGWPCKAGCAVGLCAMLELPWEATVDEVEQFFARACYQADQALDEPAGCRWFLNWHDDNPRELVREELMQMVQEEIDRRGESC